jgi:CheY-like chemotaxis protein
MNQTSDQPPKQILLVENSKTARLVITRDLKKHGYDVISVATGKEAVEILQEQPFDLIVMDVFLPEMNGYEAVDQIRVLSDNLAKKPIFGYTSSNSEFDRKRCLDSGMNEYITKSENNQTLIDMIHQYTR